MHQISPYAYARSAQHRHHKALHLMCGVHCQVPTMHSCVPSFIITITNIIDTKMIIIFDFTFVDEVEHDAVQFHVHEMLVPHYALTLSLNFTLTHQCCSLHLCAIVDLSDWTFYCSSYYFPFSHRLQDHRRILMCVRSHRSLRTQLRHQIICHFHTRHCYRYLFYYHHCYYCHHSCLPSVA